MSRSIRTFAGTKISLDIIVLWLFLNVACLLIFWTGGSAAMVGKKLLKLSLVIYHRISLLRRVSGITSCSKKNAAW